MISRLKDTFRTSPPKELAPLLNLFQILLNDNSYEDFVESQHTSLLHYDQRKGALRSRFFNKQDLCQLLIHTGATSGVNVVTISALLDRLIEWSLVTDNDLGMPGQFARYMWNVDYIRLFTSLGLIDNVLFGRSYIVDKYAESVPALVVDKSGTESIGTAFLVAANANGTTFNGHGLLLTAKHNVDPAEDITFLRVQNTAKTSFEMEHDSWILHPDHDIAAIRVAVKGPATPIYLFSTASVLSPTISLGYPKISSIDQAYLFAHNGEINAIVKSYLDRRDYLLISNAVSPGNSGGPVLDELGLCAGMIVRSLEAQYDGEISKANAAIPARELQAFVQQI